jgi:hypothetical protein
MFLNNRAPVPKHAPHQNVFILYFNRNFKKLLLNNYISVYNKIKTISIAN